MESKTITPQMVAHEIFESLQQLGNPAKAESLQRFFKHPIVAIGIDTSSLRRLALEWQRRLKGLWGLKEAVDFCEILMQRPELEAKAVGLFFLKGFSDHYDPHFLFVVKSWLIHYCDNWWTVDTLAPSLLSPILERHNDLIPEIITWSSSPKLWVRRAAVVALVPLVRENNHLDAAFDISKRLFDDSEDLIHKAVGWLLRETGKTDKSRLESFLLTYGQKIPRTTLRYAIEKFPEKDRKRLLKVTRGKHRH